MQKKNTQKQRRRKSMPFLIEKIDQRIEIVLFFIE